MSKISQERYFRSEKEVPMGFQCRHQSKTPLKNQCDCETCKNSNYAQASLTNKAMQHQNKFYKNGGMGKGSCDSLLFFFSVDHKVFAH